MPNLIKYSTSAVTYTIKKGNIVLGVNNVDYGPTSTSGFYNGITPPISGYTFYINKPSGGPSIYVSTGDTQTIQLIQSLGGTGSTIENTLSWVASQSDIVVANKDYENIVTSGMVLNLDAGFTGSYPKGNQQWYDISGSGNTGTLINGPTFNPLSGGSIVFDGTNDYVNLGTFNGFGATNRTISAWLKVTITPSEATRVITFPANDGSVDTPAYTLAVAPNGSIGVGVGGTPYNGYIDNIPYTMGSWVNITTTITGNVITYYKNGVFGNSVTNTGTVATNTLGYLGRYNENYGQYFPGSISNIQIYNRALSASEVLQNYQSTFTRFLGENIVGNGLALYLDAGYSPSYPGVGTTWYDISGNGSNGTLTNGPTFNSLSGGSIVFDGTDDYVTCGNISSSILSNNQFSVSFWFIMSGTARGDLFNIKNFNIPQDDIGFFIDTDNKLYAYFSVQGVITNNPIGDGRASVSRTTFSRNKLYHITCMKDSSQKIVMYVNGVFDNNTYSTITNTSNVATTPLWIGSNKISATVSSLPFRGNIFTTQVYNRAVTPFEVYQNYNAQKSRFGIPDIVTSGLILNLDAGNPNSYNPLNTGSTTWTDTTNTTTGGTLVNGTYYSGGTMIFDGTDDYVNISSYPTITNNITLSFWFKTSVTPSSYKGIVTTWTAGQPSLSSYGVQFKNDGTLEPVRPIGSNWNIVTSSTNVVTGSWYHCTVVYNTTGTYLYLNGVLNASNSATGNLNTPLGFKIGSDIAGTNNWNGQISNVSFYNRGLSLSEIQQNYNALKDRYGL
jgi:hypothetical protein